MPVSGTTVFRNDAVSKVTGRAKYTDDLKFYGMVHAVVVYTGYVRAEHLRVDVDAALAAPGVLGVFTAADIPGQVCFGQINRDYAMLAQERILCEGDVIALVVAETRAAALAAAPLVKEQADELPPVTDPFEALKPDAPILRPGSAGNTNRINHGRVRKGDAEAVLQGCDLVLDEEFSTQFIEHAYMEPEAGIAVPRPDGVIEIYGSMQHPYSTRRFVSAMLGEPLANVEVYMTPMGGGFGGKDDTAAIVCARAALAARKLNRPVKLTYDRSWSMKESYKRHPYHLHYRVGFDKRGKLRGADIDMVSDSGAYTSVTPWVNWRSTAQCCGPYTADAVRMDIVAATTNNVFTGAMRGFGAPQVNFAVEQLMDMAAEKLGLSPVEIRRINMVKQGDATITGQVLDNHTVSLEAVMDRLLAESSYREKYPSCSRGKGEGDELYGIGFSISYRGASLGAEGMDYCSSIINCQMDGSILLEAAIHENGQGAESVQMMILSEELGVPLSRIRYKRPSTSNIPDGGTTVATRGTIMGGGAVAIAARNLKKLIAETLAEELGGDPSEVVFENDTVSVPLGKSFSWEEAMKAMHLHRVYPYAFGTFQAPHVSWDEELGQGDAYFTFVYSAQAAELTVSRKTGKIKLLSLTAVHDIGRAINRAMVLGQMYGGIAQAVGQALSEDLAVREGRIGNLNLDKYKIPRAKDLPEIKGIIVENPDPTSPTGAKGIGEPALELMAPAIANAVYNATGLRFHNLPITINPEDLK
jgi:CO/xanthine dehydrogenase Mo-binding subunit